MKMTRRSDNGAVEKLSQFLTPQHLRQLKFAGVVTVMTLLCGIFLWYLFTPKPAPQQAGAGGYNVTIPEATVKPAETDKRKIYEQEQYEQQRREKLQSLGDVMDDLIVMNGPSLQKFLPTLKQGGTLFINSSIVPEEDIDRTDVKVVKAPVTEMALEMGNAKVLNVIMLGVYVGYTEVVSPEVVWGTIEHKLAKKAKLLPLNKEAFEKGLEIGRSQR